MYREELTTDQRRQAVNAPIDLSSVRRPEGFDVPASVPASDVTRRLVRQTQEHHRVYDASRRDRSPQAILAASATGIALGVGIVLLGVAITIICSR